MEPGSERDARLNQSALATVERDSFRHAWNHFSRLGRVGNKRATRLIVFVSMTSHQHQKEKKEIN
jgi:hypothetical protein